jgi:hypothetical protein
LNKRDMHVWLQGIHVENNAQYSSAYL